MCLLVLIYFNWRYLQSICISSMLSSTPYIQTKYPLNPPGGPATASFTLHIIPPKSTRGCSTGLKQVADLSCWSLFSLFSSFYVTFYSIPPFLVLWHFTKKMLFQKLMFLYQTFHVFLSLPTLFSLSHSVFLISSLPLPFSLGLSLSFSFNIPLLSCPIFLGSML
jgi:hypothetical protein